MIKENKIIQAFAALKEISIAARWRFGKDYNPEEIYDLMDGAEYLAGLACRDDDQTNVFESYLEMLSEKHSCNEALRVFRKDRN